MPIDNDGTYETEQDAEDAFLSLLTNDAETPSDDKGAKKKTTAEVDETEVVDTEEVEDEESDEDSDAETPSEETDEEESEESKEPKSVDKKYADSEDTYVKIKVGEEEHEVAVKDLKRLFGQEASLTKKSQEVAERTKAAEAAQAKGLAALDVMVKRAQESANPYRNVNWAALMKDPTISAEDVGALQEAARAAFENEAFLTNQLDGYVNELNAQQQAATAVAAKACIKALTDETSPSYIKGWDQKVYDDTRSFAVSMGLDAQIVNTLVEPAAIKLIHMAMQFHKGAKGVVTHKVNKAPKKIVKASTTSSPANSETGRLISRQQAVSKMKKSDGSTRSAEAAFLALLGED